MSNYSLNNVRRFDFFIDENEYWDMHLNNDCLGSYSFSGMELNEPCLASYIDTDIEGCVSGNTLNSSVAYSEACSFGLNLKNIGIIVVILNMQKVNLNIYEGDDNIIGYNDYNLNRVLSTG